MGNRTVGLGILAACVLSLLCAGCLARSEEEKQVYALAGAVAEEIFAKGTEPKSVEAAIVRDATRLAAKSAGEPDARIAKEEFGAVVPVAERKIESGFWGTPLGEAASLAFLALGLSGMGQVLRVLRNKTRIFETVVDAIEVFGNGHPRAVKDLKQAIGEKASDIKGFEKAVAQAKGANSR